ncbi:MAG: hypothetical protein RL470_647 [Actinomycetota bacterium]
MVSDWYETSAIRVLIRLASKWPGGALWGEVHRCGMLRWVNHTGLITVLIHMKFHGTTAQLRSKFNTG